MQAVRWLRGEPCEYMQGDDPQDERFSILGRVEFEKSPTREVCCEILPDLSKSFVNSPNFGLLVDCANTELVRVYAEDAWTALQPDGYSVRADCEEDRLWGVGWENAQKIYDKIPTEEREGWAEGILRNPRYQAVVVKGQMNGFNGWMVKLLSKSLNIPIIELA